MEVVMIIIRKLTHVEKNKAIQNRFLETTGFE